MKVVIDDGMASSDPLTIWAVSDGRRGMENQVLGLAEAIARQTPAHVVVKRIAVQPPFDRLPRQLWFSPLNRLSKESDRLEPPWPNIWIACGRRTIPLSIAMRKRGAFTVQTQDPRVRPDLFDLVVPPQHDLLVGENVLPMIGSPNRLTVDGLAEAAAKLAPELPPLPRPYVAALIGGNSKDYQLTEEKLDQIIEELRAAIATGYGLLVSPSRRTPAEAVAKLTSALPRSHAFVWDGKPLGPVENPYLGMLGLATKVWVTEESTNMLTDAAFTGKPVHLLPMEGGAPKWQRLHQSLIEHGAILPDASITEDWSYLPLRETDRIAAEIERRMRDHLNSDGLASNSA